MAPCVHLPSSVSIPLLSFSHSFFHLSPYILPLPDYFFPFRSFLWQFAVSLSLPVAADNFLAYISLENDQNIYKSDKMQPYFHQKWVAVRICFSHFLYLVCTHLKTAHQQMHLMATNDILYLHCYCIMLKRNIHCQWIKSVFLFKNHLWTDADMWKWERKSQFFPVLSKELY